MSAPNLREKEEAINSFLKFAGGEGLPEWPLEIFLEISNLCNLKCAMCNTFSALNPFRDEVIWNTRRGFMDVLDITSRMEPLFAHSLQVHAFGSGEPTIHPGFKEIIHYLSKFGVMVDFFTNGMHLDPDMCEFLVSRKVNKLTLSMSGATKGDYESIYLGGDFEKVTDGLKRLHRTKMVNKTKFPLVEVNSIAFQHHIEKFVDFIELMGELGVSVVHLKPLTTYGSIRELHGHVSIPRLEVEIPMLERAREVAKKYGIFIASKPYENLAASRRGEAEVLKHRSSLGMSSEFVPLAEIPKIAMDRKGDRLPPYAVGKKTVQYLDPESMERLVWEGVPCLEPFKTFYVAYSGDIYPCCRFNPSTALGTICRDAGVSIWRSRTFATVREDIVNRSSYPPNVCGGCLKAQTYPQGHAVGMRVTTYNDWCTEVFGEGLADGIVAKAKTLRPSREILAAQRTRPDRFGTEGDLAPRGKENG